MSMRVVETPNALKVLALPLFRIPAHIQVGEGNSEVKGSNRVGAELGGSHWWN